jgi:hypothetical protein
MRARLLALSVLAGCPWVGEDEWAAVRDQDGDGEDAVRFGGRDCVDDDPSVTECDADGDGFVTVRAGGDDCDDDDAAVNPETPWYLDRDADGFGDPDEAVASCVAPAGHAPRADDCDDANPGVNPDAVESCDELDLDCTGDPFDVQDPPPYYVDADRDGYGVLPVVGSACVPPAGHAPRSGDCDDGEPLANPGAPEVFYDGIDGDCDGADDDDQDGDGHRAAARGGDDCGDLDPDVFPGALETCDGVDGDCDGEIDEGVFDETTAGAAPHYADRDGDLFGDPGAAPEWRCLGVTHPGWALTADDCDDGRRDVSPVGRERCNNVDDDCNGFVDDAPSDAVVVYVDADGDGWGAAPVEACGEAPGLVAADRQGDCDDSDASAWPGAPEVCGDSFRQDCRTDVAVDDCDADGSAPPLDCLDDPADPRASAVGPHADEVCDGVDNDCDGLLDDEELTNPVSWPDWYVDFDGDGHGSAVLVVSQTCSPPPFAAPTDDDCDDARASVFPGAAETCDGRDEDCDGDVDDVDAADATPWWRDQDADGFGAGAATRSCAAPPGRWSAVAGDCDDGDPAASPGGTETCNAIDDDCDGAVDAADPSVIDRVYRDDDGDGDGSADASMGWCGLPPAGWSTSSADCDDADDTVASTATEVCNGGRDDDCDGLADEADPSVDPATRTALHPDADGDGFGDASAPPIDACAGAAGYSADATDCDDGDASVAPDQPERCTPGDDDCDGLDETAPAETVDEGAVVGFVDADGDGWGDGARLELGCVVTLVAGDCDDTDPSTAPDADETCDGADDDCDGVVDDLDPLADPLAAGATQWVVDLDEDGFHDPAAGERWGCAAWPSEIPYDPGRLEDCDDLAPLRSPATPEVCDAVDNDCDGNVDEDAPDAELLYEDGDGDGVGGLLLPHCGGAGPGWVTTGGDCDDAQPTVTFGDSWCADADRDGHGDALACALACTQPPDTVDPSLADDCDDDDPGISPEADELAAGCDAVDQDCDGTADDGVGAFGFADVDLDGFGDPASPRFQCPAPGFSTDDTDCDDGDEDVFPGQVEVCNGVDDDCSGAADDGVVCGASVLYWPDDDNDGYGDPDLPPSTTQSAGWVDNPLDCDDTVNGDVVVLGPYTTYTAFRTAWTAAAGAPCVLIEIGADLVIQDYLTVMSNEERRLRSDPGFRYTLTQGGMMGSGSLQTAGDLVIHDLDLGLPAAIGAFTPLLGVSSGTSGVLTVSNADVDLTGKSLSAPLIQSDYAGTLRTAALTLHDGPGLARAAVRQSGTVSHDLLTVRNVSKALEEYGSTSVLRAPSFEDVPEVFTVDYGGGSANATLEDPLLTRADLTLATFGSGDWTVRRGLVIDGDIRTSMMATGMATVTIEDTLVDGGGLAIDAYGVDLTVVGTSIEGAPADAIDVGSFYQGSISVTDTSILAPVGSGIVFEPTSVMGPVTGTVRDVLVSAPGAYGIVGSGWTLEQVTVVGAGLAGVGKLGVKSNPVLRDSIVWDSGTFDLGPSLSVVRTLFQTQPAAAYSSLPGQPGFVRWSPATAPATWDLRLHPVDSCTDAEAASATGGHVGFAPQLSSTDGDADTMADAWEVVWFGSAAAGDPAADPDGDSTTNDLEFATCTDPVL